ncbi:MAG: AraC family transcriptional regulator [Tissierellia bacterium]|nr:AraC family transcriptional regulator [Tissierellia bacterium]
MEHWVYEADEWQEKNSSGILEKYLLFPGFYVQFVESQWLNFGAGKYEGMNQFRVDFTLAGRFECEFLDSTFSYRHDGEVTVLGTPLSKNWVHRAYLPTGHYQGCALVLELDKWTGQEANFLKYFGVNIQELMKKLNVIQKWYKVDENEEFTQAFHELYVLHARGAGGRILLKAMDLLLLLNELTIPQSFVQNQDIFFPAHQIKTVKQIHAYILNHMDQEIIFGELVPCYDIGYTLFNKVFKAIYGKSPYQYLKNLRIGKAKKMLRHTDFSVMEIANRVGYNNASKFAHAFQKIAGTTPHQYRKKKEI